MAIRSLPCKDAEAQFLGHRVRRWISAEQPALGKLEQLDSSAAVEDLRALPGNRLEALKGSSKGQRSIRIDDQWRVCFVWTPEGAAEVEIAGHH